MTQNISTAAATARETSRNHDGKFGTQAKSEAEIDLDDGRRTPSSQTFAVVEAITEMDAFTQATAHPDDSITAKTIHGYELGLKQDDKGRWWAQPVVNDTGIDWSDRYAPGRYHGTSPEQVLKRAAHNLYLHRGVTERLHRELGAMKLADNTAPEIYSALTHETAHDASRMTIVTMDDPKNPGTSTEIIAEQRRMPNGEIMRGISKDGQPLSAKQLEETFGARYNETFNALHGSATYADAYQYGDGTSVAARYDKAVDDLKDEADEAGYTVLTAQRTDQSGDGPSHQPVVMFSSETKFGFGSIDFVGETGEVKRSYQGAAVDEFPPTARKFRQMERFAFERASKAVKINQLAATGLTAAPQMNASR